MQNYILGGGISGLLAGIILKDYKIIDANPMGQLNLPFIPGPRIFKRDSFVEDFLTQLNIDYQVEKIKIGYLNINNEYVKLDDDFKKQYSLITRETNIIEQSFLSSGENEIEILTNGSENFYFEVFQEITKLLEHKIIKSKITSIDLKNNLLELDNNKQINYKKIISTLPFKVYLELTKQDKNIFNFETKNKHFVQTENIKNKFDYKQYSYVYSINCDWTRCTYFNNYNVYEVTNQFVNNYNEKIQYIDDNKIIKTIFNLPIQIQNSIDIQMMNDTVMLGRFAQWNHKIKANEIIKRLNNLK